MTSVGSLTVDIGANISGLQQGLDQADREVQGLGSRLSGAFSNVGQSMVGLGGSISLLMAPINMFKAQGIDAASKFEDSLAEISARTGLVGDDLQMISDYALEMGAKTSFSAQQASDAFLQLLTSGSSAEESMKMLPLVLDAAAASGEDLGKTADVLTDIMASFGLEAQAVPDNIRELATQLGLSEQMLEDWGNNMHDGTKEMEAFAHMTGMSYDQMYELFITTEDAADVVDILAKAAGASSASMASLGEGFANVGGVAKNFGLSVEDTAAILAIFSENGIKGAEAGTNLKSMLLNMSRDTEPVKAAWKELGMSMYDATGNIRPLEAVMAELDQKLDALPLEEQNRLMATLGGTYGILGITALRGSISIDEMRKRMEESAPAAAVASARIQTFSGRMESLRGSIETLQIKAFTPLIQKSLTPFIEKMTDGVNWVTTMVDKFPELTYTVIQVVGAISAFAGGLTIVGGILMLLSPAIGVLASGFALLTSPIALAAAALAGFVYFLPAIKEVLSQIDFSGLTSLFENLFSSLGGISLGGTTVGKLASSIRDAIVNVANSITFDISSLGTLVTSLFNSIKLAIAGAYDTDGLMTTLADQLEKGLSGINIDFSGLGDAISTEFQRVVGDFRNISIQFDTAAVGEWVSTHFAELVKLISLGVSLFFGGLPATIFGIGSAIATAFKNDFLGIKTFLDESGITTEIEKVLQGISDTITGIWNSVFGGEGEGEGETREMPQFVKDLQTASGIAQQIGTDFFGRIANGLRELGEGMKGFHENGGTAALLDIGRAIVAAIGGLVLAAVAAVGIGLEFVLTEIGQALPGLGAALDGFVGSVEAFAKGDVKAGFDQLSNGLRGISDSMKESPLGAIVILTGAYFAFSAGVTAIGAAAAFAAPLIAFLISPIGLLAIAVALADWDMIADGFERFGDAAVKLGEGDIGGALGDIAVGVGEIVAAVPVGIADKIIQLLESITGMELPSVDEGLGSWATTFSNGVKIIELIVEDIKMRFNIMLDDIKRSFDRVGLEIQLAFVRWVSDLRQRVLDATASLPGGAIDIAPNIELNKDELVTKLGTMTEVDFIAEKLQETITKAVDTGYIEIDPTAAMFLKFDPAGLAAGASERFKLAVTQAMELAVTSNDAEAFSTLLPVALELGMDAQPIRDQVNTMLFNSLTSGDETQFNTLLPLALELDADWGQLVTQTQAILTGALSSGDQTTFDAFVPLALELGINPDDIKSQVQSAITNQDYSAQIEAALDVYVSANVTVGGNGKQMVANDTAGGGTQSEAGTQGVKPNATGVPFVQQNGLAWLHRGEAVLTASENRKRSRETGGQITVNVATLAGTPRELAELVRRELAAMGM